MVVASLKPPLSLLGLRSKPEACGVQGDNSSTMPEKVPEKNQVNAGVFSVVPISGVLFLSGQHSVLTCVCWVYPGVCVWCRFPFKVASLRAELTGVYFQITFWLCQWSKGRVCVQGLTFKGKPGWGPCMILKFFRTHMLVPGYLHTLSSGQVPLLGRKCLRCTMADICLLPLCTSSICIRCSGREKHLSFHLQCVGFKLSFP